MIIIFSVLIFLLQTNRVQQFLVNSLLKDLSKKVNSEISIGKVEYKLFNTLSVNDLYIEDLQGDTLVYVENIKANFHFFQFFKGKINIYSLDVNTLYGNIVTDEEGNTNLDFLIEAFSNPEKSSDPLEYSINELKLEDSEIKIRKDLSNPKTNTPNLFDSNDIHFKDISSHISLDVFNKDTFSLVVHHLSALEKSGFQLSNLRTKVSGSSTEVSVPYFEIELPRSKILLSDIVSKYEDLDDLLHFSKKLNLGATLDNSVITLDDLGAFIPEFKSVYSQIYIATELSGTLDNLNTKNIEIKYGDTFRLYGSLDLNGLPDLNQTFIYGNIKELRLNGKEINNFLSDFMKEPFAVPEEVERLGIMSYSGNISGFFNELVLYGNLRTDIGNISTDILVQFQNEFKSVYYDGTLKSTEINLGGLIANDKVGKMSFYFNTAGSKKINSSLQGTIDARISQIYLNGYNYQNIHFDGNYSEKGFNGILKIQDENLNATFTGLIDLTDKLPQFDLELIVEETNLHTLNLTEKYPDVSFALKGKTNMWGNSLDNLNGFIRFDSILLANGDKILEIDRINFNSRTSEDYTYFEMESDYINGYFSGNFKYSTLLESASEIINQYIPLFESSAKPANSLNRVDINLTIRNTYRISEVLDLPYFVGGTSTIRGYLNEEKKIIDIVANFPKISANQTELDNVMVHVWGKDEKLEVILEANMPSESDYWNFSIFTAAQNNYLTANLEWRNKQEVINRGEFKTITEFNTDKQSNITAITNILPSEVIISNSKWNVSSSDIQFNKDNSISFNNFRFGNQYQHLNMDGIASKNEQDSLTLEMQDIDLEIISNLANMTGFRIGGEATGKAVLYSVLDKLAFNASIFVKDLQFNRKILGDGNVFATWDEENKQILAIAEINDGGTRVALGECSFLSEQKRLDIDINAEWVNIDFLTRYFEAVLPNTKGYATGKLHIGGNLGAIRYTGRLKVNQGELTVGPLGSKFFLNDSIILRPYAIEFNNTTLYDKDNHAVYVNGTLPHRGNFKDIGYDLNIQTKNALVMDLKPGETGFMFGQAYGEANVRIRGNNELVNINVDALSKPGTKVHFQAANTSNAMQAGFIHFVQPDNSDEETPEAKKQLFIQETSSHLVLNLQVEITPDAEVEYIIDPVEGDMISGRGSGNIRVEYDNWQDEVKMYGSYVIDNGTGLFTLLKTPKKFKIENGSSISWVGSPSNAQVNIKAIYSLTASLKDLINENELPSTRTSVPVNCILILTDDLMSPTVKYEIDLPASDEGVKQQVKSVISTEEMLTNQIVSLLFFGKFNTPDYIRESNSSFGIGANEFRGLASSMLSGQLNNFVSQFLQSNVLTIGFDWRRTTDDNNEYQVDLLYQPNERWIINGNFGYRENNQVIENYNQLITDIDIEYLLTKSGKLRVKAYNHTIDRAQLKNAKNTQGIGFMYKEDFDSVGELFKYYWRLVANIGKKEKNEELQEETHTE